MKLLLLITVALATAQPFTVSAQPAERTVLTVPVRVHLITGLEFSKRGKNINNWVTPANFSASVLPEINRLWKPAGIQWEAESVVVESAESGPDLNRELKRIKENESLELATFRRVFAEAGAHPKYVNLYLVPSFGSANGMAVKANKFALVSVWRKKGPADLQRAPIVQSSQGLPSVAKTCAHELGHILGLMHPDDRQVERLMQAGPGTELTTDEITTARARATKLGK